MFKFNNKNTRKRCEISSKLTIKTPEDVINLIEVVLMSLLLTLNIFRTFSRGGYRLYHLYHMITVLKSEIMVLIALWKESIPRFNPLYQLNLSIFPKTLSVGIVHNSENNSISTLDTTGNSGFLLVIQNWPPLYNDIENTESRLFRFSASLNTTHN